MRRPLAPAVLLAVFVALVSAGCNCGKPITMMTQSSITLPLDVLDFGVVAEGTSKGGKFRIDNMGRASVTVAVTLDPAGSADFVLGTTPTSVEAGGFIEVPVTFTPVGPGLDEGGALIAVMGEDEPLRVNLKGGPIEPRLSFLPNPLAFGPGNLPLERKTATLRSVGTSALNIRSVGVDQTGNPNFSVVPPSLPARLMPGEVLAVVVEYARTARTDTGFMEVLSDDADAGRRLLELFPDPPTACTDRVDNDGDGLTDFPADPGCQDVSDEDETNAAQCVNGATQPCDIGSCQFAGTRMCMNTLWGQCMGSCDAGVADAGVPDAGVPDAGSGSCNPNGTYQLDAGVISYTCCDFGLGPSVEIDISEFTIQSNGTVLRPLPDQPQNTLTTTSAPMCPSGSFTYRRVYAGSCTETYTVTGNFAGPNTFVGTYSVQFTGSDCTGSFCASDPCTDQTWNISAGR